MPCREIREVALDHPRRVLELRLRHRRTSTRIDLSRQFLHGRNDFPPVPPSVEVAAVDAEHFADQGEFLLPEFISGGRWEEARGF